MSDTAGQYDAQTGGPHGQAGAWISVLLIVAAFVIGVVALIEDNNVVLWIIAGVVLVLGGIGALASRIMELAH